MNYVHKIEELIDGLDDANLIEENLIDLFNEKFSEGKAEIFSVAPGRVNLIGDHTDYNNGFVLPITTNHGVYCILGKSNDSRSNIYSANFDEHYTFSIQDKEYNAKAGYWSVYISGVLQELCKIIEIDQEINATIYGNVPIGAGLSSSAAIEISFANGILKLFDFELKSTELIKLCQSVEIKYAGVNCGIMDQFVSQKGKKNHALFLDCDTLEYSNIPIKLEEHVFVIVNSNVKRELASSIYNKRAHECQMAINLLNSKGFQIKSLREITTGDLDRLSDILPVTLKKRIRHVVTENKRVQESMQSLLNSEYSKLGDLMLQSHDSLKNDYEVSCDELDFLVQQAEKSKFVSGARMTGGGFGGSTVQIVKAEGVKEFISELKNAYKRKYNIDADVYVLNDNLEKKVELLSNES